MQKKVKKAALVYQAGIANVFSVEAFNMSDYGREAKRLMQHDFHSCECFARGLVAAGVSVVSAQCNQAGDVIHSTWSDDLGAAPFSDKFHPVFSPDVQQPKGEKYTYDATGRTIITLGKFEGEPRYSPYYFTQGLDGAFDEDENGVYFFILGPTDYDRFPELKNEYGLGVEESEQGFVTTTAFPDKASYDRSLKRMIQDNPTPED